MPPIHAGFPTGTTLDTAKVHESTPTGLSPSLALRSSRVWIESLGSKGSPQHHISLTLLQGIQFALYCFQSPLLTASRLISSPPGTKMFQFPGFPILTDLVRSRIRIPLVQRLRASRQGLLQLVTSFVGALSLAIHLIVCCLTLVYAWSHQHEVIE
jgi:hypothetical protein